MPKGTVLGPHKKVYSGEFIGKSTVPQFKWICETCFVEGADPFIFGPPFRPDELNSGLTTDAVQFAALQATRDSLGGVCPPCAGDYGNPSGIFFEGQFPPGHL